MSARDILGQAIEAGMTIAFAKRVGDVAKLQLYFVHAVAGDAVKARPVEHPEARMSTIRTTDAQAVIFKKAAQ